MSERRNRWSGVWWLTGVALVLVKLWLTRAQTLQVVGTPGSADPAYVDAALAMVRGDWEQAATVVPARGWLYCCWLTLWYWLDVPLLLANQLVWAASAALLLRTLRPVAASPALRLGLFAVLLWQPMTFDAASLARLHPAQLNFPLALLAFAGITSLVLRRSDRLTRLLPWAVLLGGALGCLASSGPALVFLTPGLLLLATMTTVGADRKAIPLIVWSIVAGCTLLLPLLIPAGTGEQPLPQAPSPTGMLSAADYVASSRTFSALTPLSSGPDSLIRKARDLSGGKISPRIGDNPPAPPFQQYVDIRKTEALQLLGKALRTVQLVLLVAALVAAIGLTFLRFRHGHSLAWLPVSWGAWLTLFCGLVAQPARAAPSVLAFAALYPLAAVCTVITLAGAAEHLKRALGGQRS